VPSLPRAGCEENRAFRVIKSVGQSLKINRVGVRPGGNQIVADTGILDDVAHARYAQRKSYVYTQ